MAKPVLAFEAIGTKWRCELLSEQPFPPELETQIMAACEQFDRQYSRFRDDSLVMELYRSGEVHNPPEELVQMLAFADEMYQASHGAFNVMVGNDLHRLGYGNRTYGTAVPHNVWELLRYSSERVSLPKGVMIDFGGFGKGWLIDTLAEIIHGYGIKEFIVNGGGDLYVRASTPQQIALQDPRDQNKRYGNTAITKGALAASSTLLRTWEHDDNRYHHIIDPETHTSLEKSVVGTFIKADSAKIADALATTLLIRPDIASQLMHHYRAGEIIVK